MIYDALGEPMTDARWHKVELCIREFILRHPKHWEAFKRDLNGGRSEYNLATEGDLKKASWRNTASFPVIYRKATPEEKRDVLTGFEEDDYIQVASLADPLKVLIPGLLDPDKPGQPNRLYRAFLKRFPIFIPSDKQ